MLLNDIGQSITVRFAEKLSDSHHGECLNKAPLLVCNSNALETCRMPNNWEGCLVTSAKIFDEINKNLNINEDSNLVNTQLLPENEPTTVRLPGGNEVHITIIPIGSESTNDIMFLIKDELVIRLYTECINDFFGAILTNQILRKAIKDGIDILYIDDAVFHPNENDTIALKREHASLFQLRSLVYLVRPRKVMGTSLSQLPPDILNLCKNTNLYYNTI